MKKEYINEAAWSKIFSFLKDHQAIYYPLFSKAYKSGTVVRKPGACSLWAS